MIRKMLTALVAIWGLNMISLAWAEDTKPAAAKPTFFVSGGSCSRSWRVYSKHETINQAVAAAQKLRSEKTAGRVVISVGGEPVLPPDRIASMYQVYGRACRSGWQPGLRTTDMKEVKKAVDELTRDGRDVEIVYEVAAAP